MLSKLLKNTFFKNLIKTVFAIGIFLAAGLFIQDHYQIKNINLQTRDPLLVLGIEKYRKQISFLLNEKQIKDELDKANPQLTINDVKISLPDTLNIKVEQNAGTALLKNDQGMFLLAGNGKIIKKEAKAITSLPNINYYQKFSHLAYSPGDKIDFADIIFSLNLIDIIQDFGYSIDSIDIQSPTMIVLNLNSRKKIVVNPEKKAADLKEELNIITKQLKIRGMSFSQLDLRFNKPVISF